MLRGTLPPCAEWEWVGSRCSSAFHATATRKAAKATVGRMRQRAMAAKMPAVCRPRAEVAILVDVLQVAAEGPPPEAARSPQEAAPALRGTPLAGVAPVATFLIPTRARPATHPRSMAAMQAATVVSCARSPRASKEAVRRVDVPQAPSASFRSVVSPAAVANTARRSRSHADPRRPARASASAYAAPASACHRVSKPAPRRPTGRLLATTAFGSGPQPQSASLLRHTRRRIPRQFRLAPSIARGSGSPRLGSCLDYKHPQPP